MFKVLVVAYYFPPMGLSGVQRTLKFVKYMKNYNWDPTVITTGDVGYFAHDLSLQKELESSGVRVVRVGGKEPNSLLSKLGTIKLPREIIRKIFNRISQTFFIPDNKISWAKKAFEKADQLLKEENFNALFISGPPFSSCYVLSQLKKKYHIPFVVDYRDLWVDYQFSFYITPFHRLLNKRMEYKVLKAADKIIATNRRIKEKLIKDYKFLSFDDIYIIPHGYDPDDFNKIQPENKSTNKMIITYAGIFYEYITPKYFLKAFKKLSIERPELASSIKLYFIGFLRNENRRLISKLKIQDSVTEFGYLNHSETISKLMLSDVLWLMVGNGKRADTVSSGKLYEYFGTLKPIIACLPEGALKRAAEEYKASFITEPDDIEEIKNLFIKIYNLYVENKLPLPDTEFVEKHRRDFLTEQLVKQFNSSMKVEMV